ncbi:retrotransposon protein, putative, unclassified [Tanacetum coccineum]|uniref:Retrotransposon protein, putative, unclassified n=1 Tax=Tanacetum coccineum TaxID=301880 RepID=A0ABQ5EEI3_9ASTR
MRSGLVERLKSQIFVLSCVQRRAGLKRLKDERVAEFNYCVPYFYNPFEEDETKGSTIVELLYPVEPPVYCEFDWEFDEVEELSEDQKDAFKEFLKENVQERKRTNREVRQNRKQALEELSQEKLGAINNTRFYKFYPLEAPDNTVMLKVVEATGKILIDFKNPFEEDESEESGITLSSGTDCNSLSKLAMQITFAQGVWEAVEPKKTGDAVDVKMNKMALAAIYQGIPEDMLLSLAEKETAKETWTTLKTTYMGADRVKTARVQTLKAEFEVLSMKEMESVDEFATKLSNVVSNIRALGDKIEETYVVKKLLRAVPSKFVQIASTIEQFGDLDHMSVEEVVGRLKTHEERIKGHVEADEKKLLLTQQEWSERNKKQSEDDSKSGNKNYRGSSSNSCGRGRGRGRGNWSGNRGGRGRGGGNQQRDGHRRSDKNHDKSKVQCYNCQQYGHYAAECQNPCQERNQEAKLTQENNDGEPASLLSTFDEDDRVQEVFLNEENVNPRLKSATDMGGDTSLCNIISLGQLAEGGDQVIMHGSFLWVHDVKGKLLMKVRRSPNRLYKIQLEEVKSRCLLGKSDEEVKLWHTRHGRPGDLNWFMEIFVVQSTSTPAGNRNQAETTLTLLAYSPQQMAVVERRTERNGDGTKSTMKGIESTKLFMGRMIG